MYTLFDARRRNVWKETNTFQSFALEHKTKQKFWIYTGEYDQKLYDRIGPT